MPKIKNYISQNITIISFLMNLILVSWIITFLHYDLGLSLLTGFVSVLFTVSIIDHLIKHREKALLLSRHSVTYDDAVYIFNSIHDLWMKTYLEAVDENFPSKIEEFYSEEYLGESFWWLHLLSPSDYQNSKNWADLLVEKTEIIKKECQDFLNRHSFYSDPELYKIIHYLSVYSSIARINSSINDFLEKRNSIQDRPPVLGCFTYPPDREEYNRMIKFYKWLELTSKNLTRQKQEVSFEPYQILSSNKRKQKAKYKVRQYMEWDPNKHPNQE